MLSKLCAALRAQASSERAEALQRFFKTSKGEYGEGDIFLGLTVPQCRAVVQQYTDLSLVDIEKLLHSKFHEERLVALLILVYKFEKGDGSTKQQVVKLYLQNTTLVNNWDLVDLSAPKILGVAMFRSLAPKHLLTRMARSQNLWERRIAIIATLYFIAHNQFSETLRIATILLHDPHDLIHKAVGWMLREVGKRNFTLEEQFVRQHAAEMPRTMLRYAIERWPEKLRKEVMA